MEWEVVDNTQRDEEQNIFKNGNNLRSILDSLGDLILVFDLQGTILDCNGPFTECLDKEYSDILGRSIKILGLFTDQMIDKIITDITNKQKYTFEDEFFCAKGNSFPATINTQRFYYGKNEAILCKIIDIAEKKKVEADLKSSEQNYFEIIENGNDGIVILQDREVKFANLKALEMTGYTKEEAVNRYFLEFIVPEYHEKALSMYIDAVSKNMPMKKRFELHLLAKNRKIIPVEVSNSVVDFEGKKAYLIIFRDTTERKKIESLAKRENERLENYLDVAGSIIGILDKDQNILFVNNKGCEVLGYSKDEIIGRNWFDDFLPEKVKKQSRKGYEKMMAGEFEPPEYTENWILTKSGEERLIYWHDVALKDEDGNIIGGISSGEDITDQKLMQKKISDSEHKLHTIFNSIDDEIYICDTDRNIIAVNDSVVEHLGYSRKELLNMKHDDIVVPELRASLEECDTTLLKNKHNVFETLILKKNGSAFPVEINAKLVEYEDKKAIICSARDISERKKVENELRIYAEELKESNELKELFTDIIRHDLLTPASIVKGFSEELLREHFDDGTTNIINKIHDNNERLISLLESATKLSKFQKVDEIEFENLNIVSIFQMVIDCLKSEINETQKSISINTDIKCDAKVNYVIEEVFTNLLSNAIKYSPDGSNISVDFIDHDDEWKVTVSDEGIGIADEDKGYVFDRFRRVDKKGIKGVGLGLAIVKRIVELHGGRFGVEDNPKGHGSIFWITVEKSQ
ncbi:PAS domain S-box protein [Methanolobus sp. ZRKC3]|uniref:PAS domain-containing sensor histidine kinase n=1 Tax=Methanolobus sp. ZRKC3 TaxID=3125786 RepID=UPI0032480866